MQMIQRGFIMPRIFIRAGVTAALMFAVSSTVFTSPIHAATKGSAENKQATANKKDDGSVSTWKQLYEENMKRLEERRAELKEKREERAEERKTKASEAVSQREQKKKIKAASYRHKNERGIRRSATAGVQEGISSHRGVREEDTSGKSFFEKLREKREARIAAFKEKLEKNDKSDNKRAKKVSKPRVAAKGGYGNLIAKYAAEHGVPYNLARAVVQVESSFRPNVTGSAGEIGLMQIKLATARGMGYSGSAKSLYDPATNLYWGMKYLGRAHQLSGGTTCGTILKYNAGHYAKRSNPISARYCRKVQQII